jgi:hypothetical protein
MDDKKDGQEDLKAALKVLGLDKTPTADALAEAWRNESNEQPVDIPTRFQEYLNEEAKAEAIRGELNKAYEYLRDNALLSEGDQTFTSKDQSSDMPPEQQNTSNSVPKKSPELESEQLYTPPQSPEPEKNVNLKAEDKKEKKPVPAAPSPSKKPKPEEDKKLENWLEEGWVQGQKKVGAYAVAKMKYALTRIQGMREYTNNLAKNKAVNSAKNAPIIPDASKENEDAPTAPAPNKNNRNP